MKSYSVTNQMKATEQYFPVVLFMTLYEVVLTFEWTLVLHVKNLLARYFLLKSLSALLPAEDKWPVP